jgi:hypothetical protein
MVKKTTASTTARKTARGRIATAAPAARRPGTSARRKGRDTPIADPDPIVIEDGRPLEFTLEAEGIAEDTITEWDVVPDDATIDVDGPRWLFYRDDTKAKAERIQLYTLRSFHVDDAKRGKRSGLLATGKLTITIRPKKKATGKASIAKAAPRLVKEAFNVVFRT